MRQGSPLPPLSKSLFSQGRTATKLPYVVYTAIHQVAIPSLFTYVLLQSHRFSAPPVVLIPYSNAHTNGLPFSFLAAFVNLASWQRRTPIQRYRKRHSMSSSPNVNTLMQNTTGYYIPNV